MSITEMRTSSAVSAARELRTVMQGRVVLRGDDDYARMRQIWNRAVENQPALLAICETSVDVQAAVRAARRYKLPLSVRCGGHDWAGRALCANGLVIDLTRMREVVVDMHSRVATVAGGASSKDVAAAAGAHGLVAALGNCGAVGMSGLTLGGGYGSLIGLCGLAADNLLGAEVVLADGRRVTTGPDEEPELFWAIRGGGGNFGVVTSFEFQAYEVGPTVFAGLVFYRGEDAAQVLRGFGEAAATAPDELSMAANLTTAPPLPFLPEDIHGKPIVAVLGVWSGRPEDGDAATQPFRRLAPVVADVFSPMPYLAMQTLLDPLYPRGMWNYFRSAFFGHLDGTTIDALVAAYAEAPNAVSELHVHHLGGAMGRVPADATAFGTRDREFILNTVARTPGAEGFDTVVEWARSACAALGPDAASYVNFTGEASEEGVRASYPAATYARLASTKGRYDPTNLFRLNQNIRPSAA